jgi:Ca2+-transporting ATPase
VLYVVAYFRGQGELDARALTFTALVFSSLAMIVTSTRSTGLRTFRQLLGSNPTVPWIVFSTLVLLSLALYVPKLREVFRFSMLHPIDLGLCLVVGLGSAVIPDMVSRIVFLKRDRIRLLSRGQGR